MSWAFAKFRNSATWAIAAWSGLIYCLTQDFIGIVALFSFSLIATGAIIGLSMIVAGAFVLLVPPVLGIFLGFRIGNRYTHFTQAAKRGKERKAAPVIVMVFLILVVQALLAAFLIV
jgi:hypothetical protein